MAFARNVASTVHVFAEGYDVETGPPEKVFENPQHPVTQAFLKQALRD
jgi:polar amino acid transport system ATP-binding protein